MIITIRLKKLAFLLISGAFLTLTCFSLSSAELLLSTDIPVGITTDSFEEKDIIRYDDPGFSLYLSGFGLPDGVNVSSFSLSGSDFLFSVDVPTELAGVDYECNDLIRYTGSIYEKLLDGQAIGIPGRACIDAATELSDESIVFSLDIPVSLGGADYQANDLIQYNNSTFSLYFGGSDIPDIADIDGAHVTPEDTILFSLDVPADVTTLEVRDKDIIEYNYSSYSLYFDGLSAGLPMSADVDAFAVEEDTDDTDGDGIPDSSDNCPTDYNPGQEDSYPPDKNDCGDACECEGNFNPDEDNDVDGSDAALFKADFGRGGYNSPCTDSEPCNGDFECDSDVDGTDAAVFKSDFGRGGYNNPCPSCPITDPWCAYPETGIRYTIDFLESGNPGGWTSSLKTFDDSWNMPLFSEVDIDVWLNDCPEDMIAVGLWMEYNPSRVNILSVEAYDNNYLPGPWNLVNTTIVPDYDGPGTYYVVVGDFAIASVDGDDDIIIVKVRLRLQEPLQTDITFSTIPGFETVVGEFGTIYDPEIDPKTVSIDVP